MSIIQLDELIALREELEPTDTEALLEWMKALSDSVPAEEWSLLPIDGAARCKEYLYGVQESQP
jgi:hypothetical protein